MMTDPSRSAEPSRRPETVLWDPLSQRQIQEPITFLDNVHNNPTESAPYGNLARPWASSLATAPDYVPTFRVGQPNQREIDQEYPAELRPLSEHAFKIPYVTKEKGWSKIPPGPPTEGPLNDMLAPANGAGASPLNDQLGSAYNSTGDLGVGGLAFNTQAGAGLGYKQIGGGGYQMGNVGLLDNQFGSKTYSQIQGQDSVSDGLLPYDVNTLYGSTELDRGTGISQFYQTYIRDATKKPAPTAMATTTPTSTATPTPIGAHGPNDWSPFLDLTGQHRLCPPATMADQYTYCTDPIACGPDTVHLVPIQDSPNHYYCTDPELPYNTLQSCPEGTTMVDNNSACVTTRQFTDHRHPTNVTSSTPTPTPTRATK